MSRRVRVPRSARSTGPRHHAPRLVCWRRAQAWVQPWRFAGARAARIGTPALPRPVPLADFVVLPRRSQRRHWSARGGHREKPAQFATRSGRRGAGGHRGAAATAYDAAAPAFDGRERSSTDCCLGCAQKLINVSPK